MNFALTDEQELLREAARDALGRGDGVAAARAALDGAPLPDLWPTAVAAGWSGLLVAERHGGAGLDAFDAMLVLEECGRALTGAGLLGHLMACAALRESGDRELLSALADGGKRAAFAPARPPSEGGGWTVAGAPAAPAFDGGTVSGRVEFVPDLVGADVIVVAGEAGALVVDPAAAGVGIEDATRCDATRPLGHLTLAGAPARLAADIAGLAQAWYLGQALLAADALGVQQAMLDLGVAYAKERHAFGRPIGSYQAVKHQLVDILRWVDQTRNLTYYAGYAFEVAHDEIALAASCARFAGEQGADYATRTCIAVHGGIGATWEHAAPFYWRRAQLSRLLLGGTADAGDRVAVEIIAKARAEAAAQRDGAEAAARR